MLPTAGKGLACLDSRARVQLDFWLPPPCMEPCLRNHAVSRLAPLWKAWRRRAGRAVIIAVALASFASAAEASAKPPLPRSRPITIPLPLPRPAGLVLAVPRSRLAELYGPALTRAEKADWRGLAKSRRVPPNPALETVLVWLSLRHSKSTAKFEDIARFLDAHPVWPERVRLLRRAEAAMNGTVNLSRRLAWFSKHRSRTTAGRLKWIKALKASGANNRNDPCGARYVAARNDVPETAASVPARESSPAEQGSALGPAGPIPLARPEPRGAWHDAVGRPGSPQTRRGAHPVAPNGRRRGRCHQAGSERPARRSGSSLRKAALAQSQGPQGRGS